MQTFEINNIKYINEKCVLPIYCNDVDNSRNI